jgi:hypothetical protein
VARLAEVAVAVRSKNAGPFTLTIDIVLPSGDCMDHVLAVLTPEAVAKLYKVDPAQVEVIPYPPAAAVKINLPRETPSGHPGDRDVYGAQQHAPLLDVEIPHCGGLEPNRRGRGAPRLMHPPDVPIGLGEEAAPATSGLEGPRGGKP